MCLPVTEGWYAPEKSEAPTKCPAGQQTSSEKDSCKNCINGYYNPEEGKKCKRCPDFTFPNSERTKCVPYDRITTKDGNWTKYIYITTNNIHFIITMVNDVLKCITI